MSGTEAPEPVSWWICSPEEFAKKAKEQAQRMNASADGVREFDAYRAQHGRRLLGEQVKRKGA